MNTGNSLGFQGRILVYYEKKLSLFKEEKKILDLTEPRPYTQRLIPYSLISFKAHLLNEIIKYNLLIGHDHRALLISSTRFS